MGNAMTNGREFVILRGDQVLVGKVGAPYYGRKVLPDFRLYTNIPQPPENTPSLLVIPQADKSNLLDTHCLEIELLKDKGIDSAKVREVLETLNAQQKAVGFSSKPIKKLKKIDTFANEFYFLLIPTFLLMFTPSHYINKFLKSRIKLRKVALEYAEREKENLKNNYGFYIQIPESYPQWVEIIFDPPLPEPLDRSEISESQITSLEEIERLPSITRIS